MKQSLKVSRVAADAGKLLARIERLNESEYNIHIHTSKYYLIRVCRKLNEAINEYLEDEQ
jgi:predicted house-cleaning noncanonical NTP pyrophosphatase (MazG superfamily)